MVLILGLIVSLVPIMRLKDFILSGGVGLKELPQLSQLSWQQLWSYLKGFVDVSNSCAGFEKFEVEDSQDQLFIYTLIDSFLEYVGV